MDQRTDEKSLQHASPSIVESNIGSDRLSSTRRIRPPTPMLLPNPFLQNDNANECGLPLLQIAPVDPGLGPVFILEDSKKKDKEEEKKVGDFIVVACSHILTDSCLGQSNSDTVITIWHYQHHYRKCRVCFTPAFNRREPRGGDTTVVTPRRHLRRSTQVI